MTSFAAVRLSLRQRDDADDVVADTFDRAFAAFRLTDNTVHPHEALAFERPLDRYLAEPDVPHLFQPTSVQET